VVIAFIGSVFSPYYARALRKGQADPMDHCAINVALYGRGGHHWAMTERTGRDLSRDESQFTLGPSSLTWDGTTLTIRIEERTAPHRLRLAGTIRLTPELLPEQVFELDAAGRHTWRPIAASARVEVDIEQPGQRWSGHGYMDSNHGTRPLKDDFIAWDWARGATAKGPVILYDIARRDGSALNLALGLGADGMLERIAVPAITALPITPWRMRRATRCDAGQRARVTATLEDTPFYARSVVTTRLSGEPVTLMHESVDLDRLQMRWSEALMPFRMPRRV
jgi:carotenoid 1,2-hydratase